MKKRMISLLLFITMISTAFVPYSMLAASAVDNDTLYTATVRYYDEVQITYALNYPTGSIWNGAQDIPIGGTKLSDQIYCVDPFVPFIKYADDRYWEWPATVAVKNGYVSAAPWNVSAAMRQSLEAVYWLTLNGYRGDYRSDDGVSRDSVIRLNDLYSGLGEIDKTIAVMATKVAIWKVLAGNNIQILYTSIDDNAAKKETFYALVDALLNDATSSPPRSTGEKMTELKITIDDGKVPANDGTYIYYGPLTVSAGLTNSTEDISDFLDKVFLTVSGADLDDIEFVDGDDNTASRLPDTLPPDGKDAKIYGTNITAQYLSADDFTGGVSKKFYIKMPIGRGSDKLTVKAYAMAKNVPVAEGTPVIFIGGDGNIQDWEAVQAFIGGANKDMSVNLYAEAAINTVDSHFGNLYISKVVESESPIYDDTQFIFQLLCHPTSNTGPGIPVNLNDYPVHSTVNVLDPDDGKFTLKNGEAALFEWLPADYYYWVEEIDVPDEYNTTNYEIKTGSPTVSGSGAGTGTGAFRMDEIAGDIYLGEVTFTNQKASAQKANIYVGKLAVNYFENGDIVQEKDKEYKFVLEYFDETEQEWLPVILDGAMVQSDSGKITDGQKGEFVLETLGTAYIEVDAGKSYRIKEEDLGSDYYPMYAFIQTVADGGEWVTSSTQGDDALWDAENGYYHITDGILTEADNYYRYIFINSRIYDLSISKTVSGNYNSNDLDRDFKFQVLFMDTVEPSVILLFTEPTQGYPVYIDGVSDSQILLDSDGLPTIFTLKSGQTATIKGLPGGTYKITELPDNNSQRYNISYKIGSAQFQNGTQAIVELQSDMSVEFLNSVPYPYIPDGSKETSKTTETTANTTTETTETTATAGKNEESTTEPSTETTTKTTESTINDATETENGTALGIEKAKAVIIESGITTEELTEPTLSVEPADDHEGIHKSNDPKGDIDISDISEPGGDNPAAGENMMILWIPFGCMILAVVCVTIFIRRRVKN